MTSPTLVQLVKPDPEKSNFQLRRGGLMVVPSIDGLPVTKPPYGRVTALDLRAGHARRGWCRWARARATIRTWRP